MKILKKIVNFIEKNRLLVFTAFISLFVINYIFYVNEVTPYGKYTLLCVDFYHQYGPMTYELWHRILTGSGFVYSFFQGIGLPFYRNFMNYLSSPFNILIIFFTKYNLLKSFTLIIGAKAFFASLTMEYYLSKKFKSNSWLLVPIAILYAYSGYYRAYYWNLMWIDGMVWLPLITLGIENIINNKKWKLYLFSLAIMLYSNYFIGYMICIFSVIYFIIYGLYKLNIKGRTVKENLKVILKRSVMFGGSSILAGMLVAFALIPTAGALLSTSATGSSMPTTQYYDFEFIDFIMSHFSCIKAVNFKSDDINAPNISAGIISIYLFFNFLTNMKINKKAKVFYLILLGIIASFFFIPQLDFIMQAFHVPNDLPYRYSFLYTFVFLIISAYAIINIEKNSIVINLLVLLFTLGLVIVALKENWVFTSNNMMYINMIILGLFSLFIMLGRFLPMYKNIFYVALACVAAIDVIESTNYVWNISQVEDTFVEYLETSSNDLNYINETDNSMFYRIEEMSSHTLNDSAMGYYNGITTFSSMAYESLSKLNIHLGLKGNNINSYEYVMNTPIYNMMFDVKYLIGDITESNKYEKLPFKSPSNIYRFKYTTGLAYAVNEDILNWQYDASNSLEVQSNFVEATSGMDDVLEEVEPIKVEKLKGQNETDLIYKYTFKGNEDLFYYYGDDYSVNYIIFNNVKYFTGENDTFVPEEVTFNYPEDYNESYILTAPSTEDTFTVVVNYKYMIDDDFALWQINEDEFLNYYNYLSDHSLTITSYNESDIKGQIDVGENQVVYTSIPYDVGWEVYVDGIKTKTFKIGDSLIGFNASEGTHNVEFIYHIPYFKLGLICTVISIICIYLTKFNDKFYRLLDKVACKTKKILPKRKTKLKKNKKNKLKK